MKSQIEAFPAGKLVCTQNRNHYYKWYCSDGHQSVYIPKQEKQFAEKLAEKKYLSLCLEDLEHERKAIDFYAQSKAEEMLCNGVEYQELLGSLTKPKSQKLYEWMKAPYQTNESFPQNKIYRTSSENMVRSKSEALIDMVLGVNKVPFRYECALQLGDNTIFPDFTIMHPETEELYYWEHFGKMDNPKYAKGAGDKLQLYIKHGIIPSINLITTFETIEHPLDTKAIEDIVKAYFL